MGYPFDSGDHNILWLAIGGPRKGLPIAPRFQACDGHGACVILDRPETQPRGPIACRPASGAPGCILGAVCWRPWIDQTTTPRGYLSQVDTPLTLFRAGRCEVCANSRGIRALAKLSWAEARLGHRLGKRRKPKEFGPGSVKASRPRADRGALTGSGANSKPRIARRWSMCYLCAWHKVLPMSRSAQPLT